MGRGKGSYGAIKKVEEGGKNIIMKKCLKRQIKLAFFSFISFDDFQHLANIEAHLKTK